MSRRSKLNLTACVINTFKFLMNVSKHSRYEVIITYYINITGDRLGTRTGRILRSLLVT